MGFLSVFRRAWARYRARKSTRGVVVDFLFLAAVVVAAAPPLRRGVMTYALRVTLVQPQPYDKIVFLGQEDGAWLLTPEGRDTLLSFPPRRPALVNVGSVWSAQSRAEMRSVAAAAERLRGRVDFFFVSADEPADVLGYLRRRGYSALRPLFVPQAGLASAHGAEGLVAQMAMSVPSSIVVDGSGQVVAKKLGAARWAGARAEAIFRQAQER